MNSPSRTLFRPLALLAVLALAVPALRAADDEGEGATVRAKFSDPGKPGTLRLSIPWAEAHVTGTDGNEIVVTSSLDEKNRQRETDHEGFRRLDEDLTFELVEKNNVAVISVAGDNAWVPQGAEFTIKVPRNTNLILRTEMGGDIEVEGVEGDIDINSMNGEVTLRDVSSSAVVNTMNGEIHASFRQAPAKPVSLSSMNGEIDLSLPGNTKANLRMRTHNGSIRTNFPEGALQTKSEKTPGGSADSHLAAADREMAREMARADRERARAERDAAREAIRAAVRGDGNEAPTPTPVANVDVKVDAHVAPVPAVAPVPPVPPVPSLPNFGGKSIVGTLNGGGVDIKLTSMNGTITLRESK